MLKIYKVKVTSVDYCIDEEDVEMNEDVPEDMDNEDLDEWFEIKIAEIESTLPQELELEVEAEEEDLDDVVVDAISEETGWLVNSFTYEIISEENAE